MNKLIFGFYILFSIWYLDCLFSNEAYGQTIGLSIDPFIPATGISTDSAVQVSMHQDSLFLTWSLNEDSIQNKIYLQVLDTTGSVLVSPRPYLDDQKAQVTANGPPSWFEINEQLFLLWTGVNDTIYYSRYEGITSDSMRFTSPAIMPGASNTALQSSSTPRATVHGDSLLLVWQAVGSQSVSYGLTAYASGVFSDVTATPVPGSNTASAVSLTTLKDTTYLTHRGITGDEQLYFTRFANDAWTDITPLTGFGSTTGPALGVVDSTLIMLYKGATGDTIVYYGQYNMETGNWPLPTPAFGVPGATQTPSFVTFGKGRKIAQVTPTEVIVLNSLGTLDSWMANRWSEVQDKRLLDLVIPGSHDAGMYTTNNCSPTAVDVSALCLASTLVAGPLVAILCEVIAVDELSINDIVSMSTQTQVHDFEEQLEFGYRYFDLRPDYTDDGFYAGHFCTAEGIVLGCQGDELSTILSQINGFLTDHAEVVTIKLSHYYQDGATLGNDTTNVFYLDSLYNLVTSQLGDNLFKDTSKLSSRGGKVQQLTLEEILGTNPTSGKAIVVLDELQGWVPVANDVYTQYPGIFHYIDYTAAPPVPMPSYFFEVYDSFAGTDAAHLMEGDQTLKFLEEGPEVIEDNALFLFSWTLTQQPVDIFDGPSILSLATKADGLLPGGINRLHSIGAIEKNSYPNILFTDYSNPFSASVAVNLSGERLAYQAAHPGAVINEVNHNPDDSGTGSGRTATFADQEFIEIVYKGEERRDLLGYTLKVDGVIKHSFEESLVLQTNEAIVLVESLESIEALPPCAIVVPANQGSLELGDDSGVLQLVNPEGRVIDRIEYAMEDPDDHASFTRPKSGGNFVRHSEVGASLASPGTDELGLPFNPCVEFGMAEMTIKEGTGEGFVLMNTVEIVRHGDSEDFSIVQVTANDENSSAIGGTSAEGNVDYQSDEFPHTLVIIPGVNEREVLQLLIRADTLIEETDTLVLELSTPDGATALGAITQSYLFIQNDDSVTVGLEDMEAQFQLVMYPNPTSKNVVLSWAGLNGDTPLNVQIIDVRGKPITQQPWDSEHLSMDLSNLNAGLYILQIETKQGHFLSKRLLVQ